MVPQWLSSLLKTLDIGPADGYAEVLMKAEALANRLAPNTRRMYGYILIVQGLAVMAPLLWLLITRSGVNVSYVGYFSAVCAVLLVAVLWWARWRGMQHNWARARVVAEIARSGLATQAIDLSITQRALASAPSLASIAAQLSANSRAHKDSTAANTAPNAEDYLQHRVLDQLNYYRQKRRLAQQQRDRLSKTVTLCVDAALFLAVMGLIIALRDNSNSWLLWSGSDYVLAFIGALLPLIAILMQLRGNYLDLDRRVGRYAQQIEFLEAQNERLTHAATAAELREVVYQTEVSLLSEVSEWYYQTEHNQPYYRTKTTNIDQRELALVSAKPANVFDKTSHILAISAGFVGRVLFGRVIVVAVSIVVTTALIHYNKAPQDPNLVAKLNSNEGELLIANNQTYTLWQPTAVAQQSGLIVIAHGLRDGVQRDIPQQMEGDELTTIHWMTRLQQAIHQQAAQPAEIVLVNWREAARPSAAPVTTLENKMLDAMGLPKDAQSMLNDLSMIRPQGERVGELVGFKLAREYRQGQLSRQQPLHLIGHSAGGFVVLHAALVLKELGLAPENMRVTMLDTPLPVANDIAKLAEQVPVDFYVTSSLAVGVPEHRFSDGFSRFNIAVPPSIDPYTGAHSYAHRWFIDSVSRPELQQGFARSSFAKQQR
ncbi:MAG: hypothetical protein GYB30_10690 [Gammaproteobacteria bacterium]|nr:hypothetical protein [Gammaproteobacteria bacterium]